MQQAFNFVAHEAVCLYVGLMARSRLAAMAAKLGLGIRRSRTSTRPAPLIESRLTGGDRLARTPGRRSPGSVPPGIPGAEGRRQPTDRPLRANQDLTAVDRPREGEPYRFTIQRRRNWRLGALGGGSEGNMFYVLRRCVLTAKLQRYVLRLLNDTWFLPVGTMR